MRRIKIKTRGLTLVELIVVITILVILGTIAFVQLGSFSWSARDSVRISNATALYRGLTISYAKTGYFPMPDSPLISLTYSGAIIGTQGNAGQIVQSIGKMSPIPNDPVTGIPFTYSVNASRSKAEIRGFLESSENVSQASPFASEAYAGNISGYPFTRGDALGVILSNTGGNTNTPIHLAATGSFEIKNIPVNAGYVAYQDSKTVLSDNWIGNLGSSYASIPWAKQFKLTASDRVGGDWFGHSVSLSSDGNTAIVGAHGVDPGGTTDAGAAYIFIRSGGTWTQQAKLTASDKAAGDYFGISVSLSSDGSTAIVGARQADPGGLADAGAAYLVQ